MALGAVNNLLFISPNQALFSSEINTTEVGPEAGLPQSIL